MRRYLPSLCIALVGAMLTLPTSTVAQDEADPELMLAYAAALRSDLRNLVVAQEMHYAQNSDYARSLPQLGAGFTPSLGVTIVILTSSDQGWSGIAIHGNAPGYVCGMYVGDWPPPLQDDAAEGEPTCKDPDGARFPPR